MANILMKYLIAIGCIDLRSSNVDWSTVCPRVGCAVFKSEIYAMLEMLPRLRSHRRFHLFVGWWAKCNEYCQTNVENRSESIKKEIIFI